MPVDAPFPETQQLMQDVSAAAREVGPLAGGASSGGTLSIFCAWVVDPRRAFPTLDLVDLPQAVPELAGGTVLFTAAGRRLRDVVDDPAGSMACFVVQPDGRRARVYTAMRRSFTRVSGDLATHLSIHADQVRTSGTNFHALIHARPLHLTFLSHVPRYQDHRHLSRQLLRWEPELLVHLPEGIGTVPYLHAGSEALTRATVEALGSYRLLVWQKQGVVSRSATSLDRAAERIDCAEIGARYECLNFASPEPGAGLTGEELRQICDSYGVKQSVY